MKQVIVLLSVLFCFHAYGLSWNLYYGDVRVELNEEAHEFAIEKIQCKVSPEKVVAKETSYRHSRTLTCVVDGNEILDSSFREKGMVDKSAVYKINGITFLLFPVPEWAQRIKEKSAK